MGFFDVFRSVDSKSKRILKDYNDVEDLDEVLDGILALGDSKVYEEFREAFKLVNDIYEPGIEIDEVSKNVRFIKLAKENLSNPRLRSPGTDLIQFLDVLAFYRIIDDIYYVYFGKKLGQNDLNRVSFSGLDERIVFGMDKFDKISNIPVPTAEFFQKLRKVDWKDKKVKNLSSRLHDLNGGIYIEKKRQVDTTFGATENIVVCFLAGSSSVNNNRDKIIEEDVIRANKTYLKLINTDITKLV